MALRELILAGETYRSVAASTLGLTVSESQAVSYLLARGPLGQTELATVLGLTTGSVTALVDRLERRVLAQRTPHPTDRRRSIVQLTEPTSEKLAEVRGWMEDALTAADIDDMPQFARHLLSLAEALRDRVQDGIDGTGQEDREA